MENEFDFVVLAYLIAILPLLFMFLKSRKKYKKLKREYARSKVEARK